MERARAAWVGACALALVLGCLSCSSKDGPAPANDRTLAKLREEQARNPSGPATPGRGHAGPPEEDPNAALANAAAADTGAPKTLPVPGAAKAVTIGDVRFEVKGLARATSLADARVKLTTDQSFLTVTLATANGGDGLRNVDLGFLRVTNGTEQFAIARDAQHVAGTKRIAFGVDKGQRAEVELVFEVPQAGPQPGWALLVPAATVVGGTEDAKIPLQ